MWYETQRSKRFKDIQRLSCEQKCSGVEKWKLQQAQNYSIWKMDAELENYT